MKTIIIFLFSATLFSAFSNCSSFTLQKEDTIYVPKYSLTRYEKTIKLIEKNNPLTDTLENHNCVIFYGSSTLGLWKPYLKEQFSPIKIKGHGFGGSTFPELIYYSSRVLFPYKPKLLVIYCENDIFNDPPKTVRQTETDMNRFFKQVDNTLPNVPIIYLAMKHSKNRDASWEKMSELNEYMLNYATKDNDIHYIDLNYTLLDKNNQLDTSLFEIDQLHLNEKGYQKWADTLKPLIQNILKTKTNGQ